MHISLMVSWVRMAMVFFTCLVLLGCSPIRDRSQTSGTDLNAANLTNFCYRESSEPILESAARSPTPYFVLFVPDKHALTSDFLETLPNLGADNHRSGDSSNHLVVVVRYQYAVNSPGAERFRASLPDISIPKDPYIVLVTGMQEVSRSWVHSVEDAESKAKMLLEQLP